MRLKKYEIHIYDDVCVDLFNNGVLDKSINNTYKLEDLLNQQDKRIKELEQEKQQLKQQLHDLPNKIVEEIEKNFTEYLPLKDKTGAGFYCRLNAILKKFGGENE